MRCRISTYSDLQWMWKIIPNMPSSSTSTTDATHAILSFIWRCKSGKERCTGKMSESVTCRMSSLEIPVTHIDTSRTVYLFSCSAHFLEPNRSHKASNTLEKADNRHKGEQTDSSPTNRFWLKSFPKRDRSLCIRL